MIYVHDHQLKEEYESRGYVVIGIMPSGHYKLVHPERTCCAPMRNNKLCLMDLGHKGRHSSVVYGCDQCDKTRRGSHPYRQQLDSDGSVLFQSCFMCANDL
jgi:hypothetical protein